MIRNLLFSTFFFSGILILSLIFLPSFFFPQKIALFGGKIMGYWTGICLKYFLNTKIEIKGKENIIKSERFFIAASHQSMFETFYLQTIFNSPIFILKKELTYIPIFGWYLKKIGSVSIKRNKVSKDNLDFFGNISEKLTNTERPLIIFPQGTRVLPDERPSFKKGVSRIYDELKITCQPVAINSGYVWPKRGIKNNKRTITISILEPIHPGMSKDDFLKNLENCIYAELDLLC